MPVNPYHAGFNPKLSVGVSSKTKRPPGLKIPKRSKGKHFSWKRTRSKMQKRPGFGMKRPDYTDSLKRTLREANIPIDEWNELDTTEREQVLEELFRILPSLRRSSGMSKLRKKGAEDPAHTAMLLFKKAGVLYRNLHEGPEPSYTYGTEALKAEIEKEKREKEERKKTPHITPMQSSEKKSVQEVLEEHRVQVDPYQSYDHRP